MGKFVGKHGGPYWFVCSACRRKRDIDYPYTLMRGLVQRVILTGKEKKASRDSHGRADRVSRQYKCMDCGHVGWSKHTDLKHASDRRSK
jgi:hypothetical protein